MNITYKRVLMISCLLAAVALFVPVVWLEVSSEGYKVYGPTVPHVYIYGGAITGKDTSFDGIAFAIQFQRIFILLFILLAIISIRIKNIYAVFRLLFVQLSLLLLFPFWLAAYVSGVMCNSDGAGLTEHYHIGMLIYSVLLVLNITAIVKVYLSRETA
ncbi:MAG: hypothetical protein A3D31_14915 [Candidatus Fluviicola riflensis]|nr:MAG: hypothetical protein CHH17_19350 [Candidatus Fluviicola riflensis]OGS78255.1 MAG: hypothetical protein A3D31_14915 [Candidatus Fluviicola riflensis]OGS85321.1 MAG: hypothetical protein A2724_11850 [Fluviicola sp. RIFCSPHIGHO2_01_FULL_43_53]OGS87363.1 MAG: hypothetical protein A3E30_08270 [Fluviicola sp. RIFCSPHIGHO2_12_FULL_43_24]